VREQVVLSLGSNLDDRLAHLQRGVSLLAEGGLQVTAVSSVYETAPVGGPDQDAFLNVVVVALTDQSPDEVLSLAQRTESAEGRVRHERWGPRTLDIDIVTFGQTHRDDASLTLPHPRADERAFVLVPWLEVDPDATIPGRGRVAELVRSVSGQDVTRRGDLELSPGASR
jgi:2-amino-4-hydroxy-6-hydroxymethyldihydropteridine diphosphokinase